MSRPTNSLHRGGRKTISIRVANARPCLGVVAENIDLIGTQLSTFRTGHLPDLQPGGSEPAVTCKTADFPVPISVTRTADWCTQQLPRTEWIPTLKDHPHPFTYATIEVHSDEGQIHIEVLDNSHTRR